MTRYFLKEIEKIKESLFKLGSIVEECVIKAVRSVTERDAVLAKEVLDSDEVIDNLEVELEEECMKILALHQPVAQDLRFIIAVLKINNDFERIGDLGCNIAWRGKELASLPPIGVEFDMMPMVEAVKSMLKKSLQSLLTCQTQLAVEVCVSDDHIDKMNREIINKVKYHLSQNVTNDIVKCDQLLMILSVARNLERIADHCTNVAEDVIYMVSGEITRHGRWRK